MVNGRHWRPVYIGGALGSIAWLLPAPAAASGGVDGTNSTSTIVVFLAGMALAYVLANFVVQRLQRRFLVLSGSEYMLLGLLLGPAVTRVVSDVNPILPIIALTAGWIGLLRGMELQANTIRDRPEGTLRIVALHQFFAGGAVGGLFYWLLTSGLADAFLSREGLADLPWAEAAVCAFALACAAASDSSKPFDVLQKRYKLEGSFASDLRRATRLGDVQVMLIFSLLFAVFHPPPGETSGTDFEWMTEWAALELAIGVGLGLLFTPFLGGNESSNGRFLALVGIITFASGSAYFLQLSPLGVNVILGVVLVNIARTGKQMHQTLATTELPMTIVLSVLAGALWSPPPLETTAVVLAGFIVVRLVAKGLASRILAWSMTGMRKDLYRGLLAHGDVTVAMAVSFQVVFDGPLVDVTYTVILLSVVVHDLFAPRLLRSLLVDAGALRGHETPERSGELSSSP